MRYDAKNGGFMIVTDVQLLAASATLVAVAALRAGDGQESDVRSNIRSATKIVVWKNCGLMVTVCGPVAWFVTREGPITIGEEEPPPMTTI